MPKKKSLIERLRETTACDPECHGRCQECPDDLMREAAAEIERLSKKPPDLSGITFTE